MVQQGKKHSGYQKIGVEFIRTIAQQKNEPGWMIEYRLAALELFFSMPLSAWGVDLSGLEFDDICYYLKPLNQQARTWQDVPESIKNTFDQLGILQAEQQMLAGVGAQFESEVIYKSLKDEWIKQGVVFLDMNGGLAQHEDLVKRFFGTVIPSKDNKFAALNSAVWSGGSFVYVPAGVQVTMPWQAYFRINQQAMGQFERTLIIAEPGSFVHYVEGCSAPLYQTASLHSAVVELIALPGAHIRYTTIQNWSTNVYNLVTKRAVAHEGATVEWIDGNFGSYKTMKYPSVVLKGMNAKAHVVSIAVAHKDQHHDSGAKVIHLAPHTSSTIVAKSLCQKGGRASFRGLVKVVEKAYDCSAKTQCDALLFDDLCQADTYPTFSVANGTAQVKHEALVTSIDEQQLLFLASRGISEQEAKIMIAQGFLGAFIDFLPMEYAVELNRLIRLEMEGSVG
ncbi:Fe-S cluster assembly protein SufB [bacterium]|nr:MAG: Fe-S cluster assembly protein SufB [bacterium]